MPPAAVPVTLTAAERKTLKKRVRGAKTPYRDRLRAQIVLAAARGRDNARIAADLGTSVNTVRKWRGRFAERGLAGLKDLPRSGRPRRISEADRAAVVALACQLPAATGVPLSRWTGPELAAELTAQGLVSAPMSVSSLLRILAENPVKPWQYQSWIYPRDPDFEAKANVILDLYQGFYQGEPLGPGRPDPVLRRQAVDPGPRPHPRDPARRARQARPRRARVRPPRRARAARRPGRPYRQGVRLHPEDHGNRPVHGPRRPGHGPAGVQERAPRVRHRGQRLGPPRQGRRRPAPQSAPERDHDPHPGPRLLAEPDRDLLLHHPEESRLARTTSPAWSSYPKPCSPSSTATTRPRGRSTGNTPPTTSRTCSAASANTTTRHQAANRPHGGRLTPPTNLRGHPLRA